MTGDIKINYITNLKHKNIPAQLLKGLYPFPLDKHLFNYNYFCQLVVRIHQRHTMSLQEYDKKNIFEQRLCIVFQHFAYLLTHTFLHPFVWFWSIYYLVTFEWNKEQLFGKGELSKTDALFPDL